jgi:hypothetical protein
VTPAASCFMLAVVDEKAIRQTALVRVRPAILERSGKFRSCPLSCGAHSAERQCFAKVRYRLRQAVV